MIEVKNKWHWVLLFAALLGFYQGNAQDETEKLREKKKKLEQDIRYTTKLLSETAKNRQASLSQLSLIRKRIASREQLIVTIGSEVEYLRLQIEENKEEIEELNNELEALKQEYARMIYHAYKTRSRYHKLMFVFSADNFNQAYRRLKYFRQYSDYRKQQALMIQEKKSKLNNKIAQLKEDTERKVELLASKEQERQKLRSEREGKTELLADLKRKESKLERDLRKKRAEARALENEIERIIAEQMKKEEPAEPEASASAEFRLTPGQVALSENFTSNKGKLPWPTKRGIISSTFGVHRQGGISIQNNGITIRTSRNSDAHAVFSGKVTKVISIGNKKAVLVQHGDYFTLYDNLSQVKVSPGHNVATGDVIGKIKTDNSSGVTEVNFQIWQAKKNGQPSKLNPQFWLLPQ